MSDRDLPTNGPTPLMDAAVLLHELFITYMAAGFGREEALYLVAEQIKAASTPDNKAGDQP